MTCGPATAEQDRAHHAPATIVKRIPPYVMSANRRTFTVHHVRHAILSYLPGNQWRGPGGYVLIIRPVCSLPVFVRGSDYRLLYEIPALTQECRECAKRTDFTRTGVECLDTRHDTE